MKLLSPNPLTKMNLNLVTVLDAQIPQEQGQFFSCWWNTLNVFGEIWNDPYLFHYSASHCCRIHWCCSSGIHVRPTCPACEMSYYNCPNWGSGDSCHSKWWQPARIQRNWGFECSVLCTGNGKTITNSQTARTGFTCLPFVGITSSISFSVILM